MNKTFPVAVDPDILDLAKSFVSNRRSQIQTWREAAAAGNARLLHRLGHEVKGTAGAFGLKAMSELGAELEHTVADGNLEGMGDAVERMVDFISRVVVVPRRAPDPEGGNASGKGSGTTSHAICQYSVGKA